MIRNIVGTYPFINSTTKLSLIFPEYKENEAYHSIVLIYMLNVSYHRFKNTISMHSNPFHFIFFILLLTNTFSHNTGQKTVHRMKRDNLSIFQYYLAYLLHYVQIRLVSFLYKIFVRKDANNFEWISNPNLKNYLDFMKKSFIFT